MKIKNMYYRSYQYLLSKVQYFLPWHMPKVTISAGSLYKLPDQIKMDNIKKILIITTAGFVKRGGFNKLSVELKKENIAYELYSDVQPDPTINCIEDAAKLYIKGACEAIIAVGGGSVIDCAKIVGARVVKPHQSIIQMTGMLKIRKKLPPLYAVPTTAGTGSEVTIAAVITDDTTHYKYTVNDLCLLPKYAILDPELTCTMPKSLTASTGIDALTHAVESYINKFSMKESRKYAMDAVKLIFSNLIKAYENGNDITSREKMLMGSYYAGLAFTRAYIGYVHAIAHAIGGLYGVPHGTANAVILPVVLDSYGEDIYDKLAELADAVGIYGVTSKEKSQKFIQAIKHMNHQMGIPDKLGVVRKEDIPEIIKRAIKEANPNYPVPVIWNEMQFQRVIKLL